MEAYGFTRDYVWNELTFDQIALYGYLAHERENRRAEYTAAKTIEYLAKALKT